MVIFVTLFLVVLTTAANFSLAVVCFTLVLDIGLDRSVGSEVAGSSLAKDASSACTVLTVLTKCHLVGKIVRSLYSAAALYTHISLVR